jgi:CRISPR-associated protein Csb2
MPLAIRVQFLAGYSGREWPPSPARLFKALVASARAGWAHDNREIFDASLRVLEQQGWSDRTTLPEIVVPRATLRPPRQRRFIPNNSKNWPTERKLNPVKGIDLDEEPMVGWDLEAPHTVWYWWPSIEAAHVPILRDVSRRVFSVGKGEDLAVVDATDAEPPTNAVRWQPSATGASLEVPEAGCLDVCDAVFARDLNGLPLAAAGVRAVTYASDVVTAAREVPTFVLGLWRSGKRCSWDARLLRQVVGPVRHLLDEIRGEVVDLLARSPSERPAMEALVRRVLVGHDQSDKPIAEPHLAVLPVPSVLGPYPDGRVRQVALADFGGSDDPIRRAIVEVTHMAGEIVDVIQRQLNNHVGPACRRATEALFHLVVEERPFENQVSLSPRQPDVRELPGLDPLAPHQISSCTRSSAPRSHPRLPSRTPRRQSPFGTFLRRGELPYKVQ